MTKTKKQGARMRWEFDADIPTESFFDGIDLEETGDLENAVEDFVDDIEQKSFQTWEAVVCEEQGLPLTKEQKALLEKLISFGDPHDERILYIDEMPRPAEQWFDILRKLAPHLLLEPFVASEIRDEVHGEGWRQIAHALREHGQSLSLPDGVSSPEEVVPADLRHRLWLQVCFDDLSGLGESPDMTLADEEEHHRIDSFVDNLRQQRESVAYFDLTLESLLTRVILPPRDAPIFCKMIQERLGLLSVQDKLAPRLG